MTLDDLLPHVLPHVKQCPNDTARFHLREAAIDFCERSLVWQEFQTPVPTVAGQTTYAYAPAVGQRVVKLLGATLNGIRTSVLDPVTGRHLGGSSSTATYLQGRMDGFEIHPAQAAGLPIVTLAAVCPTRAVDSLPASFERYTAQLARGACARIMMIANQPFSAPVRAKDLEQQFESDIGDARMEAVRGFARTSPRTTASWF